ncbi:hypothetical protein T261_2226 [Streptomyces lydicus]|nr:hypothetical protein T261_2226 [Streptomyces lydicus]
MARFATGLGTSTMRSFPSPVLHTAGSHHSPVCTYVLHYRESATQALRELSQSRTTTELLESAHSMWCGPTCSQTAACTFLHYPRSAPAPSVPRSARSRYNKDTADLFFLMGGDGYMAGTPQTHETNLWPLMSAVAARIDAGEGTRIDYSDWAKKNDSMAAEVVAYVCRDSIQWAANWCGERYAEQPTFLHYVALTTICDDICIPPLDLVRERFRMYGRSVGDIVAAMDEQGWGHDAVHALLALVRQYLCQYAEKLDHTPTPGRAGLHARLNNSSGVWDAAIYRTHSANTYGCLIGVARLYDSGPASSTWLLDSSICDAISMDLCKSAMDVYRLDAHQPTASEQLASRRQTAYHSVYLDLIDDLVASGAHDALVHFGRAGFLFVQTQDRYHERRLGRRIPLRSAVSARLRGLFGAEPVDSWTEQRFQAQRASVPGAVATTGSEPGGPTGLGTSAARIVVPG